MLGAQLLHFRAQPFAIPRRIARPRRPMLSRLSKSQIVTHHLNLVLGENLIQSYQER